MARFARCMMAACLVATFLLSGCTFWASVREAPSAWFYPHSRTLAEAPDEHRQRIARLLAIDKRAMAEDVDLLFMTERSTRLSRWHDR